MRSMYRKLKEAMGCFRAGKFRSIFVTIVITFTVIFYVMIMSNSKLTVKHKDMKMYNYDVKHKVNDVRTFTTNWTANTCDCSRINSISTDRNISKPIDKIHSNNNSSNISISQSVQSVLTSFSGVPRNTSKPVTVVSMQNPEEQSVQSVLKSFSGVPRNTSKPATVVSMQNPEEQSVQSVLKSFNGVPRNTSKPATVVSMQNPKERENGTKDVVHVQDTLALHKNTSGVILVKKQREYLRRNHSHNSRNTSVVYKRHFKDNLNLRYFNNSRLFNNSIRALKYRQSNRNFKTSRNITLQRNYTKTAENKNGLVHLNISQLPIKRSMDDKSDMNSTKGGHFLQTNLENSNLCPALPTELGMYILNNIISVFISESF